MFIILTDYNTGRSAAINVHQIAYYVQSEDGDDSRVYFPGDKCSIRVKEDSDSIHAAIEKALSLQK